MGNFDEFDLDLQSIDNSGGSSESRSLIPTYNCTTATINSIAYCTKSGGWNTCMCSSCCGGWTAPKSCKCK